jgi:hypothetical protein
MAADRQSAGLDPAAIPVVGLARMLSRAGGKPIAIDAIEADIAAGAPVNDDGSINLVHYAAWLVKEMAGGD